MLKKSLTLVGVLGVTLAAPASALDFSSCFTNGSLSACASAVLTDLGGGHYSVVLTHDGGSAGTAFNITGFGFYDGGAGDLGQLFTLVGPVPTNWSDAPPGGTTVGGTRELNLGEPNSFFFAHADCAGNPNECGLTTSGESLTFFFDLTGVLPADEDILFGWRAQSVTGLDDITSLKCFEGFTESGFECEPPTVVPEPATMALLATGLVGMGGATVIRRRRQQKKA